MESEDRGLRRTTRRQWLAPGAAGLGLAALAFESQEVQGRAAAMDRSDSASRPCVILAADGSGDFGPQTPGTRTAGWQEALAHCVQQGLDLYVKGGYAAQKAVYDIKETIRIPAAQDFRIDGGVYVINYSGSDPNADAVAIDSAMNCEYHLGLIVYGGRAAGLRIKPESPVPIDKMPAFIETQIFSQGIADPAPFTAGERKAGTGLVFDAGRSGIHYCHLYFAAVLNFHTCIESVPGCNFAFNEFICEHLHTNAHNSTLARIGRETKMNLLRFGIGVDQGASGVTGIELHGARNTLDLATRHGGFAPAKELWLAKDSEGNQIRIRTTDDPLPLVTDDAEAATNQLSWTGPPAAIRTVLGSPGVFVYTQRLYPAVVRILAPKGSKVVFQRGSDSVEFGLADSREFMMSVGDRLRIEGTEKPSLRVIPMKIG